jgi:hypothetical protein
MNFKITFSPNIKINQKPTGDLIKLIKFDLNRCITTDFEGLKEIVLNHAFICCETNVKNRPVNSKDWISQQIIAIDIDGGLTPEEFLDKSMDMKPNLIYTTLSDSPELRKFRVIWVLDDPITNIEDYDFYIRGLIDYYDSDKSCSDPARYYNPGKEIIYFNDEPMILEYFISFIESYLIATDGGRTRKVQKMAKNRRSYNNNIGPAEKSQLLRKDSFDLEEAIETIKVLNVFFNDQVQVSHNILFGIASNLQYIEGGLKRMKERMEEINTLGGGRYFPETKGKLLQKYSANNFSVLKVAKCEYEPMMLKNFSPFEEDHKYHNILDMRGFPWGRVDILEKQDLIQLEEAEKIMREKFNEVLEQIRIGDIFNLEPNIYIFKLSTGIGKTKLLENIDNGLLAFPNNYLKNEVSDRMNVDHSVTPSYPLFTDDELNNKISTLHSCGLYTKAGNLIKSISLGKSEYTLTEQDINLAKEFLILNEICRNTKETVLTTHTRAVFDKSFKHDYIIFDECPLGQLVEIGKAKLNFSEFDNTEFSKIMKPVENYYREQTPAGAIDTNKTWSVPEKLQEFCADIKRGDLIKLLDSNYVYKDIDSSNELNYVRVNTLPTDKPIIIMSATAPVEIYKKLYPNRVKVIDITNIQQKGEIIQITKRGYSSSSIDKYKKDNRMVDILSEIKEEIGDIPVITHLKHRNIFKSNKSPFYFGKCSGGDELNGQDIAVIGTPNKPQYVHYFYAVISGIRIKASDNQISDKVIEWNGFKFRYLTYDNKDLRDIQLGLVEEELIQAIGRNRTLRNASTTKVFSNLPMKISTKIIQ